MGTRRGAAVAPVTAGKLVVRGLSEPQMRQAFSCMQADFEIFSARIEHIGLAESRPYTDITVWELQQPSI